MHTKDSGTKTSVKMIRSVQFAIVHFLLIISSSDTSRELTRLRRFHVQCRDVNILEKGENIYDVIWIVRM